MLLLFVINQWVTFLFQHGKPPKILSVNQNCKLKLLLSGLQSLDWAIRSFPTWIYSDYITSAVALEVKDTIKPLWPLVCLIEKTQH